MSYDLVFWKQTSACTKPPLEIYEALMEEQHVGGLEPLPISAIVSRVEQRFSSLTRDGGLVFWDDEERGMFELYVSDQHVHFCCRQLINEDMNTIIDIAAEFGCPLFDPQLNQRFHSP